MTRKKPTDRHGKTAEQRFTESMAARERVLQRHLMDGDADAAELEYHNLAKTTVAMQPHRSYEDALDEIKSFT